ncbi:glycosyltransferase family 4 protein [Gryllotalpicola kribbensis]|uniref:glycosyltransferase family 4 protein n=1 Tax=Gryllotalpicola kribbensis TaxID=993084 RepID=UPI0031D1EAD1
MLPEAERYGADGGAIATVTHELVLALADAGDGSVVVSPRSAGLPYAGGEVVTLARSGDPASRVHGAARRVLAKLAPRRFGARSRYLAEVERVLARRQSRCIVAANDPALATRLAADGRTVVLWLHNYLQGAEADALRRVPPSVRMVAVSESVRRWTVDELGIAAGQVVTIPNAVNHELFHARGRAPRPDRPLEVVCHGRVDPNKGQVLAVRAVARARELGAEVRLTIIGGALSFGHPGGAQQQYERELHALADRTGAVLAGRVPADRVAQRLREFDAALVLPLVPEPFGLVAVEAMASGCAVITTGLGGLADVVGGAALVVAPEVEAVAAALVRLVGDEGLCRELSVRGVARAATFSWRNAAGALAALVAGDERAAALSAVPGHALS